MITTKEMTVKEWLNNLATTQTSNEYDERMMQSLTRKCGFSNSIVTCGIVYLEGKGTPEAPPMSIHTVAKEILRRQ